MSSSRLCWTVLFAAALSGCDGCGDIEFVACGENGQTCPAGEVCSASGECIPEGVGGAGAAGASSTTGETGAAGGEGGGAAQFMNGASSSNGSGGACADVVATITPTIPTVYLLVDQSGSMNDLFDAVNTRWEVLRNTLMDPVTGPVKQLEAQVRFGLAMYSGEGVTCPSLEPEPLILPVLNNFDAINAVYSIAMPQSGTPTGDALNAIVPKIVEVTEPGPKVVILATDGQPNGCPGGGTGEAVAVAAAQNAYTQGIETYIVAVGEDISDQHQQDMANAGVGLPSAPVGTPGNAPFYETTNQQQLIDAFTAIINSQISCVFTVDGTVVESKAGEGVVTVNGVPLTYNDPNGWKLNPPSEIELVGTACENLMVGDDVEATFPCGGIIE